ncbi:archaemetzincin-2 isoform 1 [Stylonychia lemnae]|uniref:Archaemetzincin-2 isoform 1 n=1 Tax=Stylonychia lemnae TaxID=5949 RepID=A0A078B0A3_STYLE|nr:archaemetzincin-2 isoform 1 [Stylonychia lemnae]|eukprot:CDW86518.1 archaemetzincin-2 isoform 1 [Stylonychia lemnae]
MKSKIQFLEQLKDAKIVQTRVREDTGIIQYNAGQLIDYIEQLHKLKKNQSHIILVDSDLYPRDGWNYIFGSTKAKSRICLISIARHDPNFGIKGLSVPLDINKIMYRAIKTSTHEFCHILQMQHCQYYECLMNGSNKLEEADRKPFLLCPVCTRKQRTYLKIEDNIIQHYEEILDFIEKRLPGIFQSEIEMYSKMIHDMKNYDSDDRYNTSFQFNQNQEQHNYTQDNDRTYEPSEYTNRTINTDDPEKGQIKKQEGGGDEISSKFKCGCCQKLKQLIRCFKKQES